MKIVWIAPVGTGTFDERILSFINRIRRPDVEPEVTHLRAGLPSNLEYHIYEHLVEDDLLHAISDYEKKGYAAAIIGCFYDGGLREAREIVEMPVIAEEEASIHVAATLGYKFSIIVGRRKWLPKMEENVRLYGLTDKLASLRAVGYSIDKMASDRDGYLQAVKRESLKAVAEDGAEVIVLSEEASFDYDDLLGLQRDLRVPVLDPLVVAWKFAELMADLRKCGISHSKIGGYEAPPADVLKHFDF
jgi:allantoin racemase